MAREVRSFAITIPVSTPIATPLSTDVSFPARIVEQIDVRVPPGPNGLVGFALAVSGQQIIPINPGQWIVANDETLTFPLDDYPDSGSWQVLAYNLGTYPHTLWVRFTLDLVQEPPPPVSVLSDLTAVSTAPTQSEADTAAAQAALDELLAAGGTDVSTADTSGGDLTGVTGG